MAFRFSTTLRNNMASQIQSTVAAAGSTAMQLRLYSGSEPASPAAALGGGDVLLCTITLPASFLTSTGGATARAGTWSGTGSANGTAGYFRIYDMAGTPVCHLQGNVTTDLVLDNPSIATGQQVTINSFVVTIGNA